MGFPLHLVISQQLRDLIVAGKYLPGEQIPSEHELMSEFKVSRTTVRKAISNLTQQGLIQVQQGKRPVVAIQQKVVHSLSNPFVLLESDLAQQGINVEVKNLVFELATPSPEVQRILGTSEAYFQRKVLLFNGVPSCVDVTYILPEYGKTYAEELQKELTFTVLEKHNILITSIHAVIECTQADYETSEQLEVSLGHPLIVYRHTAYNGDHQPIVQGESISRGDRFCYSIQIILDYYSALLTKNRNNDN